MAALKATLEAIENDEMLANVNAVERYLRRQLAEVPEVVAVKGRGFLLGLEFRDRAAPIHQALLDRKVITGTSSDPKVLRLLPPLCLKTTEIDIFMTALKDAVSA
jgi:acetylornithine/N-succinyldiaminopimelate aminotransferase